jgi:hypothetical protein
MERYRLQSGVWSLPMVGVAFGFFSLAGSARVSR